MTRNHGTVMSLSYDAPYPRKGDTGERANKRGRGGGVSIGVSVTTKERKSEREREKRRERGRRREVDSKTEEEERRTHLLHNTYEVITLHPHLPSPRSLTSSRSLYSRLTSLLEIQIPRETVIMYRAASSSTYEPAHRSPLPPVSPSRSFYWFSSLIFLWKLFFLSLSLLRSLRLT